jgi:YgiT-type zinc finger domain-containing protein
LATGFPAQEVSMDCVICKTGSTKSGRVSHSFQRGSTVVVIKEIPADVCDTCGEPYFSSDVTKTIERLLEEASRKGVEVEILRYAA